MGSSLIAELLSRGHPPRARPDADFSARASRRSTSSWATPAIRPHCTRWRAWTGCSSAATRAPIRSRQPQRDRVARRAGVRLIVRRSMLGAVPSSPATMRNHGLCDLALESARAPVRDPAREPAAQSCHRGARSRRSTPTAASSTPAQLGSAWWTSATWRLRPPWSLTEPGHDGRSYELTGPEALSYSEIATPLTRAIGWPTTYVDVPDEAMRERLIDRLGERVAGECRHGVVPGVPPLGRVRLRGGDHREVERLTAARRALSTR